MRLVIIIDDSSVLRAAIREIVELLDPLALVKEASNGKDGLALLEEETPEIVFLDYQMPLMDGHDVAVNLMDHPSRTQFKLIGMTGLRPLTQRAEQMRALCDLWMEKPFDFYSVKENYPIG